MVLVDFFLFFLFCLRSTLSLWLSLWLILVVQKFSSSAECFVAAKLSFFNSQFSILVVVLAVYFTTVSCLHLVKVNVIVIVVRPS